MNGVRATLDFEECLRNKSPIPQKLVDYCRDDVMFMSWMLEYFNNRKFEFHQVERRNTSRRTV